MRKTLSLFLVLAMLATFLTACAQAPDDTPAATTEASVSATVAEVTTEDPISQITNALPDNLKYEGEVITFVSRDANMLRDEITAEEDGDQISSAVVRRNDDIENRFGVKIENKKLTGDQYAVPNAIQKCLDTGTYMYDIAANSCYSTIMYTGNGILYDLKKCEYIDFSAPYWSQGFNEAASIGNSQYMVTGAASLALYRLMFVTMFNRNMLEAKGERSLFEVVDAGEWTLDYHIRLASDFYVDADSSGSVTDDDITGFASSTLSYIDPYWSSCKNPILSKDADNHYILSLDSERLSSTLEKVIQLFYDANSYVLASGGDDERQEFLSNKFAQAQAATVTLRLGSTEGEKLRDMKDKYGVIPIPKLNREQTEYYTFLHDQFTAFGICQPIVSEERADMLGAILEYMAWSSYKNVVPVYYNIALKSKYMQDTASWAMLDLIYSSIYIDAGVLYTKNLSSIHQKPRDIVVSKNNTTASIMKAMKKPVEIALKNMQQKILDLQNK